MAYKQTSSHRFGKGSYHQIGLVRGQFGNVAMDKWVQFIKDAGFDGWEEASWELDVDRCGNDSGARIMHASASSWPKKTASKSLPSPPTCKASAWGTSRAPRRCSSSAASPLRPTRPGGTREINRRAPIPTTFPKRWAA